MKKIKTIDFNTTVKGSLLEGFYPEGWDMERIEKCCALSGKNALRREKFWNKNFTPVTCGDVADLGVFMGHEIALEIKKAKDRGQKIALICPVGPMGMYRWAVYFLREWGTDCKHVWCFNMDEWSDGDGNTLSPDNPAGFENAMNAAFYGPLGSLGVPRGQRNFATRRNLPQYAGKIARLKKEGARLVLVYGIGRVMHIAFWEPHFAAEFSSPGAWKAQTHRLGAKLHPMTIEQNALTSFKSRTTSVPCRANTIGPGLFLQADYAIGGCDGAFGRGMQWQGLSVMTTLHYGPDPWIPSTFMPTLPGKLFILKELTQALDPDVN